MAMVECFILLTVESDFTNGVPSIQMSIGADTVGIRSERPFGVEGNF
jgi:hypothetical protein